MSKNKKQHEGLKSVKIFIPGKIEPIEWTEEHGTVTINTISGCTGTTVIILHDEWTREYSGMPFILLTDKKKE